MKILNLTQHPATPAQVSVGVFDLKGESLSELKKQLTFHSIPKRWELIERAKEITDLVQGFACDAVMIGGAPFFMHQLEEELYNDRINVLYAFSVRESIDITQDGETKKISVFKHVGFVEGRKETQNPSIRDFYKFMSWAESKL
jgi:hypothetical protein